MTLKRQNPVTYRHSVTSQKSKIHSHTAARALKIIKHSKCLQQSDLKTTYISCSTGLPKICMPNQLIYRSTYTRWFYSFIQLDISEEYHSGNKSLTTTAAVHVAEPFHYDDVTTQTAHSMLCKELDIRAVGTL